VERNKVMEYYVEITLIPSSDISLNFLWKKLFQLIHLKLVEIKAMDKKIPIGIGFPGYQSDGLPLGNKLRLFAPSMDDLKRLNLNSGLSGFKGYVSLTEIEKVPDKIERYSCFNRVQRKTNKERLARRRAKRLKISYEQALKDFKDFKKKLIKVPFINMQSQSTGENFHFFIQRHEFTTPINEGFGSYGLSKRSTVPEF